MLCCCCLVEKEERKKEKICLVVLRHVFILSPPQSKEAEAVYRVDLLSLLSIQLSQIVVRSPILHYLNFGFRIFGTEDHQIQEWLIQ